MITLILGKTNSLKVRKFWDSRQLRSIYFTFELVPKPEPIDVSVVEPRNY